MLPGTRGAVQSHSSSGAGKTYDIVALPIDDYSLPSPPKLRYVTTRIGQSLRLVVALVTDYTTVSMRRLLPPAMAGCLMMLTRHHHHHHHQQQHHSSSSTRINHNASTETRRDKWWFGLVWFGLVCHLFAMVMSGKFYIIVRAAQPKRAVRTAWFTSKKERQFLH
jgi:hypothetical protein